VKAAIAIAFTLGLTAFAAAQSSMNFFGVMGGKVAGGAPGVVAPAPAGCGGGQLDFSDGCNAVFLTGAMRP
jgi:hypothetical protein